MFHEKVVGLIVRVVSFGVFLANNEVQTHAILNPPSKIFQPVFLTILYTRETDMESNV